MNQDIAYCFNPYCSQPKTNHSQQKCNNCGFLLQLENRYQAQKLIASGRFGRTFRGEDLIPKCPCLIKQFFPKSEDGITLNSEKAIQLFHSEAKRLEELDHPQIPKLYAHLEQETYQYLIQEWISGDNLETELSQQGTFSERDIRKLLSSLLPVLDYLQKNTVIHRDIKPENIIHAFPEDRYILVDFGAAKLASLRNLAKTGTIIGSPGYAAPEQVYGKPTFASDIYSLGVTCLHLLTGVSPFEFYNPTESQLLWRDYCQDSPVSESLAAILDGMTAFDLKQRYDSAKAVLSALGVLSALPPATSSQPEAKTKPSVITLDSGKGAIYSLDFSPDGTLLASGGGSVPSLGLPQWGFGKDNCVRLWWVGEWEKHRRLTQHSAPITTVKFSPDGQFLISGSLDKTIKVWNLQTQQLQQTLKGHRYGVKTLQVSPYNDIVLSGSEGGEVILWNLQTGRVLDRLTWEQGKIFSLALSPDGESFAVGSVASEIQVWEVYQFKPLFCLKGHTDAVRCVTFSPDGRYLASGSGDWDCTIKLWDLSAQTLKQTFYGHQWVVNALGFSSDGKYLVSGSGDKTVRMVEILQDKPLCRCWTRHGDAVTTVVLSPDDLYIASGSEDETIKLCLI